MGRFCEIGVKNFRASYAHYTPASLMGVSCSCVNLGEKNIVFCFWVFISWFPDENKSVCLVTIDPIVRNGEKLF